MWRLHHYPKYLIYGFIDSILDFWEHTVMEFEVYCDEAHPDVLTSASPRARHLMIGSLWLPAGLRGEIKNRIHALRQRHSTWGEIKWTKVSRNRQDFYFELIDLFVSYGANFRYGGPAVKTNFNLGLS